MSFPNPPDKITPFGGQTVAPYDIGRQFDEHRRSITQVIDFLRSIVREDGSLQNGVLGPEAFPPGLAEKLTTDAVASVNSLLADTRQSASQAETAAYAATMLLARFAEHQRQIEDQRAEISRMSEEVRKQIVVLERDLAEAQSNTDTAINALNDMTVADESAAGAEAWSHVSKEWAEHMPDIIPPNILAMEAITGEHWSARWWAKKAMDAFGGGISEWYMGAWPDPGPPSTPYTLPLPPATRSPRGRSTSTPRTTS